MARKLAFGIPVLVAGAVLVFLAGGALTAFLIDRRAEPPAPARQSVGNVVLKQEVRRLRTEIAALAAIKAQAQQAPVAPASPATEMSDEEAEARALARQDAIYAAFDATLASEPVDDAWAAGMAERLTASAGKHAAFGRVLSVRCASTMCKMLVGHDDVDGMRSFAERIADEPVLEAQVAYRYHQDARPPVTTMWLSRKGSKLPSAPRI